MDDLSKFDNYFVNDPGITCQSDAIELDFETYKPFNGRVFVKNLPYDNKCSMNFADNVNVTKFSVVVKHDHCNMIKEQSVLLLLAVTVNYFRVNFQLVWNISREDLLITLYIP